VLAAARLPSDSEPRDALAALRKWLRSWQVIGYIAGGMARQQYDLELVRHGEEGWRATFYPAGLAHSMTSAVGTAWQRTPFDAVRDAAFEALEKSDVLG
jgi:hypothetical protein